MQDEAGQRRAAASKGTSKKPKTMSTSSADFETTFDVDGHVETVAGQPPIYNQSASVIFWFMSICPHIFLMII